MTDLHDDNEDYGVDPEADTEALLELILPMSHDLLKQQGGFQPFGLALKADGRTIAVNPYEGDGTPDAEDLIELLKLAFRKGAEQADYLATAIAFSVYVTPPGAEDRSEAVAVMLDHVKEFSIVVFQPYADTAVEFDEDVIFGQDGDHEIFSKRILN